MGTSDPTEFNLAMSERIVALGAIPVTNDLRSQVATNLLFRQLIFLLGAGGGGGSLYAQIGIIPGESATVNSFAYGPEVESQPSFGISAFDDVFPARDLANIFNFQIQLPPGAIAAFTIPPLALTANGGWIDAVALGSVGNVYNISIATAAAAPAPTTILFEVASGAISVNGIIGIIPVVN